MQKNRVLQESYSDNKLLDQIKAGNGQAFTALFNRYYQPLCRFVYVYVPESQVVEELTANIFVHLWENKKGLAIHSSLKSYLYQSAKNEAISYLRKKKKPTRSLEGFDFSDKRDQTPEAIYIETELNLQFAKAFQKLPRRAKLAFKLHRFDGLKYTEIAEIMSISVSAVEKNITSALKLLHRELFSRTKAI